MIVDSLYDIKCDEIFLARRHLMTSIASYLNPIEFTKLVFELHLGRGEVKVSTGFEGSGPYDCWCVSSIFSGHQKGAPILTEALVPPMKHSLGMLQAIEKFRVASYPSLYFRMTVAVLSTPVLVSHPLAMIELGFCPPNIREAI